MPPPTFSEYTSFLKTELDRCDELEDPGFSKLSLLSTDLSWLLPMYTELLEIYSVAGPDATLPPGVLAEDRCGVHSRVPGTPPLHLPSAVRGVLLPQPLEVRLRKAAAPDPEVRVGASDP